jgi:hypothetical protein
MGRAFVAELVDGVDPALDDGTLAVRLLPVPGMPRINTPLGLGRPYSRASLPKALRRLVSQPSCPAGRSMPSCSPTLIGCISRTIRRARERIWQTQDQALTKLRPMIEGNGADEVGWPDCVGLSAGGEHSQFRLVCRTRGGSWGMGSRVRNHQTRVSCPALSAALIPPPDTA